MRTIVINVDEPELTGAITGKKLSMSFIVDEPFKFAITGDIYRYVKSFFETVGRGYTSSDAEIRAIVKIIDRFNPFDPQNCSPLILDDVPSTYSIVNYNTLKNKINNTFAISYAKNVKDRASFEELYEQALIETTIIGIHHLTMSLVLGNLQARYYQVKFPTADDLFYEEVKRSYLAQGFTPSQIEEFDNTFRNMYKFERYANISAVFGPDLYATGNLDEAITIVCETLEIKKNDLLFLYFLLMSISDLEHRYQTRAERSIKFLGEEEIKINSDGEVFVRNLTDREEDEKLYREEEWHNIITREAAALHHLMMLLTKWINHKEIENQ